eukprot:850954-Pyramimonas_sp.AAC.1
MWKFCTPNSTPWGAERGAGSKQTRRPFIDLIDANRQPEVRLGDVQHALVKAGLSSLLTPAASSGRSESGTSGG